jgi:hypothetical protein
MTDAAQRRLIALRAAALVALLFGRRLRGAHDGGDGIALHGLGWPGVVRLARVARAVTIGREWRIRLASCPSAIVVFVLVPGGKQEHIRAANREEHDTAAMTEWDDQLPELPVPLAATTGVRRKTEDPHCAFHGLLESNEACVIRRVAGHLALDDVLFEALDVLLEREGGNDSIAAAHPPARLFLAATDARMRRCAALARRCMPARKSSAVSNPTPLSAARNAFLARAMAAFCSVRNSASRQTAFSMNCVRDSPSRSTASRPAFVSGATRMGGKVAERLMGRVYST